MKDTSSMRDSLRDGVSRFVLEASTGLRALRRTAHLICGISDYDVYVEHQRVAHPGVPCLNYAAFVRQQQDKRYGRGSARCC